MIPGGIYPGLILYLSFFYPRQKLQWRQDAYVIICFVLDS